MHLIKKLFTAVSHIYVILNMNVECVLLTFMTTYLGSCNRAECGTGVYMYRMHLLAWLCCDDDSEMAENERWCFIEYTRVTCVYNQPPNSQRE